MNFLILFTKVLITIIPILVSVAIYTLLERKVLASVQRRRGPNVTGFWGLLQPVADGLKLAIKEFFLPSRANYFFFILAPIWTFCLAFSAWYGIPFSYNFFFVNLNFGMLFFLAISALSVYGVIIGGWASNSYYALLGGLRSAAQMVSYEISFGLTIIPIALWSNSFNLLDIVYAQSETYKTYFIIPFLPLLIIYFISILAETNRSPFDLPESEAELVAGFNVEFASTPFALFFLAEYSNMLLMSTLLSILFLGGWTFFFFINPFILILKLLTVAFLFILVRGALPRYRYDQLMKICWQIFLPLCFSFFHFTVGILVLTDLF